MIDSWAEAIACAESAASGDDGSCRRLVAETHAFIDRSDTVLDPATPGHIAYFVTLLEAAGLQELSGRVTTVLTQWTLAGEAVTSVQRAALSNKLLILLADRGDLDAALRLHPLTTLPSAPGSPGLSTQARALANHAAIMMRMGNSASAFDLATAALSQLETASDVRVSREALETRLLALSVLLEVRRDDHRRRNAEATEALAAELEEVSRHSVAILGDEHPQTLSALITLAAAELEAARLADSPQRMERATDVLAVAAQKAAATYGRGHPQARAALARLAYAEYETAVHVDASGERAQRAAEFIRAAASPASPPAPTRPARLVLKGPPIVEALPGHNQPVREIAAGQSQPEDPPRLSFSVLGPVRARRGDQELFMGSPQQRALLAALLLRGGHTATPEELIDAIWGQEPPDRARAALRTYASRIRKGLGDDAELLVSESGGYAVRTGRAPVALDLDTATAHASDADNRAARGDLPGAREGYAAALAQWSGEPLVNVLGAFAEAQRRRLTEWQLSLHERRLDLDLQLGRHTEAVGELTALTAAHPLRERLRELLMLALYRSGREAEALGVFADTRRLLADELGVEPCRELSELHQRILEGDDSLTVTPDEPAGPSTARPATPAQLPATIPDFTGRAAFVAELRHELLQAEGTVMAVSAVAGIGGVGKTTLAVHVAHLAAEHFPDGQLYIDLQGASPSPSEPEAVLGTFLRSLGMQDASIPEGVEERAGLFRSLLAGRRVLTLLDNARDAAQIRPLLSGAAGCAVLVTSSARMVDLAGAYLVDLDVMSPGEAMTLFTRIVGEERVSAERQAAMDVIGACGFLPLAIRIAASRLAARRTWTVSTLASKLTDERRRLDELQAGNLAVKAEFGYGQLDAESARGFRLLGLAEGPDMSLRAAAALLDRPAEATEDLLESLVDVSLLESASPGRYRFHDLVRLFARVCAERDEQASSEREEALSRLLNFHLATALTAFAVARPGERAADHLIRPSTAGLPFADRDAALDWLFSEADCVLACVQQSAERGMLRHAADLLIAIKDCAESGVHSLRYERAATAVMEAAREAGDGVAEARTLTMLAHVHLVAGHFEKAEERSQRAVLLAKAAGDPLAGYWSMNDLGVIAEYQSRFADGEAYLRQAVAACRADGNRPGEASALCNLSQIKLALGRTESAIELARRALEIYESLGDRMRTANGLYALGSAFTAAGRFQEAEREFLEALEIWRRHRRQHLWEGMTHFRLAEVHLASGQAALAAGEAEQALALRGIGGDWTRARMLTVLGRALAALGQRDRANVCWKEALALFENMQADEVVEVRALLIGETHGPTHGADRGIAAARS